ncbi:MAG: translation initiation factor IF-2, partial [Acidobacteria bacterium]
AGAPADQPRSGRAARRADRRRKERVQAEGSQAAPGAAAPIADVGVVRYSEGITVKDLAERMGLKAKDIIKRLFLEKRMMPTINHALDEETARWVIEAFGGTPQLVGIEEEAVAASAGAEEPVDRPEDLVPRPPVVTMMGHVDHGKTSLLDAIRKSRVAEREAGGITQHIGAYKVTHEIEGKPREIVFLDTPGHEAFTLMRARGAQVTDIVVLVVAADDGVMPQTVEAINHAQAAGVPIVVAVNKIDKPGANPDRVLQQLADHGVLVEQFGGKAIAVPVSAKTGEGLSELLEMITLVADVEEYKANPNRPATGTVLEAKLDKARGPVATILVQNGTLRVGDVFVVGATMGRVRALVDEYDKRLQEAGPSTPVVVMGLEDVPDAGDTLQVFPDEQKARQLVLYRQQKRREEEQARRAQLPTLDNLFEKIKGGEVTELPIVLKADVQGSVEVLRRSLTDLSTDEVAVKVIHAGTGAITETDILLASASRALVIGFNVRPERGVAEVAAREGVDIRLHTVIYNVSEEIKQAMLAKLSPVAKEVYLGRAEVRQVFRVPKVGIVAGCYVVDGVVRRDAGARLLRDNVVVYEGKIASLRRFKDDAKEVRAGFECGIGLERFQDIKPGDEIEAFVIEMKRRESLEETHTT